jgi:hypothetical protein
MPLLPILRIYWLPLLLLVLGVGLYTLGHKQGRDKCEAKHKDAQAEIVIALQKKADEERDANEKQVQSLMDELAAIRSKPAETVTKYVKIKEKLNADNVADCDNNIDWVQYVNEAGTAASGKSPR